MSTNQNPENCNHNCDNCAANCGERQSGPQSFRVEANPRSSIKKMIGIVSGKGGVGKSFVTSILATHMTKKGYHCAILDGDITGPSIGKAFGIHEKANGDGELIFPAQTKTGIQVISANMLLEDETQPIIWRGPLVAGILKQFYQEVLWKDVDYMFVDMPPGTGDVPLTAFQSLPLDGIVIVTTPQELVGMIVEKAINMAKMMNIPILGVVENMSYVECGKCGEKIYVFGKSHLDETAEKYGLPILGRIPLREETALASDEGNIEDILVPEIFAAVDVIESI